MEMSFPVSWIRKLWVYRPTTLFFLIVITLHKVTFSNFFVSSVQNLSSRINTKLYYDNSFQPSFLYPTPLKSFSNINRDNFKIYLLSQNQAVLTPIDATTESKDAINSIIQVSHEDCLNNNDEIISFLKYQKAQIENALMEAIPELPSDSKSFRLSNAMRYSLLAPGKRLRPILCLVANQLFGGDQNTCLPFAVAVEMIHTMSLVHDDLPAMDNDSLRRGRPSNHVVYGEDVAILVGDSLLAGAYEHIIKNSKNVPPDRVLKALDKLTNIVGISGLAAGQIMDLDCEGSQNVTVDDLLWIHSHKTGSLLRGAAGVGAIIAGASDEDVERVESFAKNVGLAFQIADDILDITHSTEMLGKTAGKDLKSKKITYPHLVGIEMSKEVANKYMQSAIETLKPYKEKADGLIGVAKFALQQI